ncbi:MAG: PRC-barrel domain-containing protein [Clostridiales bacterium]|nr:PRC-barrel domain-containing protein [Clostridiales bacterium]HBM81940.1 hypothetical protein [Clostridiaceae bacterium]
MDVPMVGEVANMKKSALFSGIEVMDLENGKIIGRINDILFFPYREKVLGFSINCGRWVKSCKILLPETIYHIGNDVITIKDKSGIVDKSSMPEIEKAIKDKNKVIGMRVFTREGDELGFLEDIIIDENNMTIHGFVISGGIIDDIIKGKSIILFEDKIIFGEDSIIIDCSEGNVMLKNEMSLKKYLENRRIE